MCECERDQQLCNQRKSRRDECVRVWIVARVRQCAYGSVHMWVFWLQSQCELLALYLFHTLFHCLRVYVFVLAWDAVLACLPVCSVFGTMNWMQNFFFSAVVVFHVPMITLTESAERAWKVHACVCVFTCTRIEHIFSFLVESIAVHKRSTHAYTHIARDHEMMNATRKRAWAKQTQHSIH